MRYTTIIDITEMPDIYRNKNARMLYLHLALRSGYHDDDRDMIKTSIRRVADDVGMTVSATRHALTALEKAQLLTRDGDRWHIKKWIIQEPPTPRTQKTVTKKTTEGNVGERYEREIEDYRKKVYEAIRASTKAELETWLHELEDGRRLTHHGASIAPNQDNVQWLRKVIASI